MASRGSGAGLSAQVAMKIAGKRDLEQESEILGWIEAVLKEKLPSGSFEDVLRDGTIICRVMNKIKPGSIAKIHTQGGQFKFMENLENFQRAITKYGVADLDCFQTVDLYERRNIPQVAHTIMALGRACYLHPEWPGPFLGPRPAIENKREFSEEVLRAGQEKQTPNDVNLIFEDIGDPINILMEKIKELELKVQTDVEIYEKMETQLSNLKLTAGELFLNLESQEKKIDLLEEDNSIFMGQNEELIQFVNDNTQQINKDLDNR